MKFNILERIMILGILPERTDFISMKIINDLQRVTGFSQGELDKYKIRTFKIEGIDKTTWSGDFEKEIKVTIRAAEIIQEILKRMHEQKMVSAQHLSLYEKFGVNIEIRAEDALKMGEEYTGEKNVKKDNTKSGK
jgi:hypothetical protein